MSVEEGWPKELLDKVQEYAREHGFPNWGVMSDSSKRGWADRYMMSLKQPCADKAEPEIIRAVNTLSGLRGQSLEKQRSLMIDYLQLKVEQRDWHGVRDACVDIEILEARIEEGSRG